MGKLVLIGLVIIVAILSTMMVSVRGRSTASVDDLALRTTIQESNLLANYARQYGIRLLNDRTQAPNKAELEANTIYKKTFSTAFTVKDGAIDSLLYSYDASNNVIMDAFVTYRANDNVVNSVSRAVLEVPPPDTVRTVAGIDKALSTEGSIEIDTKNMNGKGIYGDVQSHSTIDHKYEADFLDDGYTLTDSAYFKSFEEIFGMTIDEMREIADYVGTDPGDPCDGINFMSGQASYIVNNADFAVGSGILVVEGDLTLNGDLNFTGIIWVTGIVGGLGNSEIFGAIFAAGADLTEVSGSFNLTFDEDLLLGKSFTNKEGKGPYRILAIYDDYRN